MRLAALLLAAGEGRRFGGCKQLAELDGKPLIRHALDVLTPLFGDALHVVVGAHRERVREVIDAPARIVEHVHWQAGMGSSIARGISAIDDLDGYDGLLIALADQPRILASDYKRLVAAFDGARVVAAAYGDSLGVPAVFPPLAFARLLMLDGDRGARDLLRDPAWSPCVVDLPAAAVDFDLRSDLTD